MKNFLLSVFFVFGVGLTTSSAQSEDYTATLKKMFTAAGTEASYKTVIVQMFDMFKRQYPAVSDTLWDELEADFLASSMDDLTAMLAPVYAKYLSIEDIQAIIDFYDSPAGKKFSTSTPLIIQESMQVGEAWGRKIGENFAKRMEERGY